MNLPKTNPIQDRARWQSEHGHWLKDIRKWELEHQSIREAMNILVQELHDCDLVLAYHKSQILDHKELMTVPVSARESNPVHGAESSNLHQLGKEEHQIEKIVHKELHALHQSRLKNVQELVSKLSALL